MDRLLQYRVNQKKTEDRFFDSHLNITKKATWVFTDRDKAKIFAENKFKEELKKARELTGNKND